MTILYKINHQVSTDRFIELLNDSSLGERRPVDDRECMAGMVAHADLMISAWDEDRLVGIARSVTDFHYACYLSDLAVHRNYQHSGIGTRLQVLTQEQLGPRCTLILLAAPAASTYYDRIGYTHNDRCWILERDQSIGE